MKKSFFLALMFHLSLSLFAQLDKVAPLTSVVHDSAKIYGINLLLNTKDFTHMFSPQLPDNYFTTVQLVHAAHPFPPIWYQIGTHKLANSSDFFINPTLQERTGHLTFNFILLTGDVPDPVFDGYVILDTATLLPVDTLMKHTFSFDSMYQALDNHDYEEDKRGNKLLLSQVKTRIDVRCMSGEPGDSAMDAIVTYIVVLDSNNHVKLAWNPLKHIPPCEMKWEWRNCSISFPKKELNWSHGNSVRWANDGNILYSFRHVGIGKINSTTGNIMFKLGGKDSIHAIPLPDSIGYSLQHDFYQRPDGKYSLFSNGDSTMRPYMEGLIYDIDEKNKTVQLVDRYVPHPDCVSKSLGGFDTYKEMYFFNRGMNFCFKINQMVDIINVKDHLPVAEIFGPISNFSYRVHPTTWNISRRPVITSHENKLQTDSIRGLYDYTWYKVTDSSAIKVATGLSFLPTETGNYVVESQTGSGLFISFLLSDPILFILNNSKSKKAKSN